MKIEERAGKFPLYIQISQRKKRAVLLVKFPTSNKVVSRSAYRHSPDGNTIFSNKSLPEGIFLL